MTTQQVLDILKHFKTEAGSEYGIASLGLFGSFARNQACPESDVDVVVTLNAVDPFRMVHLREALEQRLGMPVDLVRLRPTMNPLLRERIERDAIYV